MVADMSHGFPTSSRVNARGIGLCVLTGWVTAIETMQLGGLAGISALTASLRAHDRCARPMI